MTQTEGGYQHLTKDGELPRDLDWRMDTVVREKERDPETQLGLRKLDWESALDRASRFMEEEFPYLSILFDSLDGQMDVGYAFQFMLGPEDRTIVMVKLHPAVRNKYVNDVITDEVMAEACLVVTFRDPREPRALS